MSLYDLISGKILHNGMSYRDNSMSINVHFKMAFSHEKMTFVISYRNKISKTQKSFLNGVIINTTKKKK